MRKHEPGGPRESDPRRSEARPTRRGWMRAGRSPGPCSLQCPRCYPAETEPAQALSWRMRCPHALGAGLHPVCPHAPCGGRSTGVGWVRRWGASSASVSPHPLRAATHRTRERPLEVEAELGAGPAVRQRGGTGPAVRHRGWPAAWRGGRRAGGVFLGWTAVRRSCRCLARLGRQAIRRRPPRIARRSRAPRPASCGSRG